MSFRQTVSFFILCIALLWVGAPAEAQEVHENHGPGPAAPPADQPVAPRLQNLGNHHHAITTKVPRAQQFFDQGLRLSYGFNHAEAFRAFAEAARLDPDCAMCYWGQALVLGPNINAPMDPADEPRALELVQKAVALKPHAAEPERAYIDALATRYSGDAQERQARDRAYAEAMGKLARQYPDDLDAVTLYAEALMDLRPWDYATRDGQPYPETKDLIPLLESVLRRNPDHPGAIHLYIHATENTRAPERALPYADKLGELMPAAGHMVHMPSHTYMRVGQYDKAVKSNQRAALADEDYIAQCRAQGLYPLGYYPHNVHFLWWAAAYDGRRQLALDAARKTVALFNADLLHQHPFLQDLVVTPYLVYVRFGQWDEMLAEPEPPMGGQFTRAIWHYARGMAWAAKGQLEEGTAELEALKRIATDPAVDSAAVSFSSNKASAVLRVAVEALSGELAERRGESETAIAHLHRAVLFEENLIYTEPAVWPFPMRHWLGAALLKAGRPVEAEAVYWEDLRKNPENGWSLYGLAQALRAQGRTDEAAGVEARFQQAWAHADVQLSASRF
ncbi:MAG TPA: tetratricopeptide repeat protein [Candidatus Xenobia bacterium]|nr:tetratricopeptide repeat protein [Candidatus Xenobia bacterium]